MSPAYCQTFLTIFLTLGTHCCSFSLILFTLLSFLHFPHSDPPPAVFHFPLISAGLPPRPHLRPEAMGERGRDSKRQDRPAPLKTLFTPGTKRHVISARGETLTVVWRGGRARGVRVQREGRRREQEIVQN